MLGQIHPDFRKKGGITLYPASNQIRTSANRLDNFYSLFSFVPTNASQILNDTVWNTALLYE